MRKKLSQPHCKPLLHGQACTLLVAPCMLSPAHMLHHALQHIAPSCGKCARCMVFGSKPCPNDKPCRCTADVTHHYRPYEEQCLRKHNGCFKATVKFVRSCKQLWTKKNRTAYFMEVRCSSLSSNQPPLATSLAESNRILDGGCVLSQNCTLDACYCVTSSVR
jgi:hypothetical protein